MTGGDITALFPGGVHGLENTGNEDLRIIVISVIVKRKANAYDGKWLRLIRAVRQQDQNKPT